MFESSSKKLSTLVYIELVNTSKKSEINSSNNEKSTYDLNTGFGTQYE